MKAYLDLLRDVRENGVPTPTRAVLKSTGARIDALSVFGRQVRFDLAEGFPLVTTKKIHFDSVAHELIWMLRGWTNVAYLRDNGIRIWDEWSDASGELGPVYGAQWRAWRSPDGRVVDQIADVVSGIREVAADPASPVGRRLLVSSWNAADLPDMALAPCHFACQFQVSRGRLNCHLNQRSCDLFLGEPFNIASYALLTHLAAHVTDLVPGDLVQSIGDAHIYVNHLDQVDEQLSRDPLPLPRIAIDPNVRDVTLVDRDQIRLIDYEHHPTIRGEVAV